MRRILLPLISLMLLCSQFMPVEAQTPPPDVAFIKIYIVNPAGQPLAGIPVELILIQYGEAADAPPITEIPAGDCSTDSRGACTLTVSNPPRLWSGRAEGTLIVGDYGRTPIGWEGATLEITLSLGDFALAAMLQAADVSPHHGPYGEPEAELTPTLAPIKTPPSTETPSPTQTPVPTPTPTPIPPIPPTGSAASWLLAFVVLAAVLLLYFMRQRMAQ